MRKLNKKLIPAAMLLFLVSFSGCDEIRRVESITLVPETLTLYIGQTSTLIATVFPGNAITEIVWISSDEWIVTVADGVVTAVGLGTATITATDGENYATCVVTVLPPRNDDGIGHITMLMLPFDLIDVYSGTSGTDRYVDSLFRADVFLCGPNVDFINDIGFVGYGAIIVVEIPVLFRTYLTEQYAGHSTEWTFPNTYVADNELITSRDEIWTYGSDPETIDVLPFLKGNINLAAVNLGGAIEDNISGATIYFRLPNEQGEAELYHYGIIPSQFFTIDQIAYTTFMNGYYLTGQIMLFWVENEYTGEYFYADLTGNYILEQEYAGNVILVALDPWIMEHVDIERVPARVPYKIVSKSAPTKIAPVQLKKMKTTKFDKIDWAKTRVLGNKSTPCLITK